MLIQKSEHLLPASPFAAKINSLESSERKNEAGHTALRVSFCRSFGYSHWLMWKEFTSVTHLFFHILSHSDFLPSFPPLISLFWPSFLCTIQPTVSSLFCYHYNSYKNLSSTAVNHIQRPCDFAAVDPTWLLNLHQISQRWHGHLFLKTEDSSSSIHFLSKRVQSCNCGSTLKYKS